MERNTVIRTALVLATIFTFGYARAAEPSTPPAIGNARMEKLLDHQLSRHLSFPLMEKAEMTGEVFVSFVVNEEGRLAVIDARSDNEALRAFVLRKLALVDIGDNPGGTWKTEHVRFVFAPENAL